MTKTGALPLGSVVFVPSAIRVTSLSAVLGGPAQPGTAILSATSTTHVISVALDTARQSQVKVGDTVTVTLPDNTTAPGTVSSVGTVATEPSQSTGAKSATIAVVVTLNDPAAAGTLDQAPVLVSITTATVDDALVVPVTALVALTGGGYAVEVADTDGTHHLVTATVGLFDDADGLVQVTGSGLDAGQHVVVPSS